MRSNICIKTILEIRKLSRFLDKYSKYLNNNYSVTLPQMLCLYEISSNESINLTTLTKSINLNNSAVTGIVDRLEAKKFVNRVRKGTDRRTVYLEITPEGKKYAEHLTKLLEDDCLFDTNKIGAEAFADMLKSLENITNVLDPEIKKIEIV